MHYKCGARTLGTGEIIWTAIVSTVLQQQKSKRDLGRSERKEGGDRVKWSGREKAEEEERGEGGGGDIEDEEEREEEED